MSTMFQNLSVYLQCKLYNSWAEVAHSQKEFGHFLLSISDTTISGIVPPCMNTGTGYAGSLGNGSYVPRMCNLQRERRYRFFYCLKVIASYTMNTTEVKPPKGNRTTITTLPLKQKAAKETRMVDSIKQQHQEYNQFQRQALHQRTKDELIDKFFIEKNAKNRAYYFILEFGHLEAFSEYCKTN